MTKQKCTAKVVYHFLTIFYIHLYFPARISYIDYPLSLSVTLFFLLPKSSTRKHLLISRIFFFSERFGIMAIRLSLAICTHIGLPIFPPIYLLVLEMSSLSRELVQLVQSFELC